MTRVLFVGLVVGTVVATLTANDLAGWVAALVAIALLAIVSRLRGTNATCAVRSPAPPADGPRVTEGRQSTSTGAGSTT